MRSLASNIQTYCSNRLAWWVGMAALVAVTFMSELYARADENTVMVIDKQTQIDWEPEDYLNAKPTIPKVDESAMEMMLYQSTEENKYENLPTESEGRAPSEHSKPDLSLRIHPPKKKLTPVKTLSLNESSHLDNNTFAPKILPNLPFSSSLVNLLNAIATAQTQSFTSFEESEQRTDILYPYRTVGKLFYKKNDGSSWSCSGAVIRHRLVVTAASCVHSGIGGVNGYYNSFRFIPAYKNGSAPFGEWSASRIWVKTAWTNSGGTLPHSTDYGILVMNDQNGRKIWENVGFLGWRTRSASFDSCTRHLHGIGYPSSVAGVPNDVEEMRQITGTGSTHPTNSDICILGTDWGPGSGGGPWVYKFGWRIDQNGDRVINENRVISVFSTIFNDSPPGVVLKGGSVFDERWSSLYKAACDDPESDGMNCIK